MLRLGCGSAGHVVPCCAMLCCAVRRDQSSILQARQPGAWPGSDPKGIMTCVWLTDDRKLCCYTHAVPKPQIWIDGQTIQEIVITNAAVCNTGSAGWEGRGRALSQVNLADCVLRVASSGCLYAHQHPQTQRYCACTQVPTPLLAQYKTKREMPITFVCELKSSANGISNTRSSENE